MKKCISTDINKDIMEHTFTIKSVHDPDNSFVMIKEESNMLHVGGLVTSIAHFANTNPIAPRELLGKIH